MIVFNAAIILCWNTKVENNVFPSKFCVKLRITEVVLYTKVLVNDILVVLERILDYAGVRLE